MLEGLDDGIHPPSSYSPAQEGALKPQGRRDSEASAGVWLATVRRLRGQLCRTAAFGLVPRDGSCHKQTALKSHWPAPQLFSRRCSGPADLRPAHSIKLQ